MIVFYGESFAPFAFRSDKCHNVVILFDTHLCCIMGANVHKKSNAISDMLKLKNF